MTVSVKTSPSKGTDAVDAFVQAYADFQSKSRELGPEVHLLWTDAISFHNAALQAAQAGDSEQQERCLRAAVLVAAAAFEGFTNFFAQSIISAGLEMKEIEKYALSETTERVDNNGDVEAKSTRIASLTRFLLLYRVCSNGKQFGATTRATLKSAFDLRDEIVHPKPGCQLTLSGEDRGTNAFLNFMTADMMLTMVAKASPVSKGLFSRIGSSV